MDRMEAVPVEMKEWAVALRPRSTAVIRSLAWSRTFISTELDGRYKVPDKTPTVAPPSPFFSPPILLAAMRCSFVARGVRALNGNHVPRPAERKPAIIARLRRV